MARSDLPSLNAASPSDFLALCLTTTSTKLSGLQRMRSSPRGPSNCTSKRPLSVSCETTLPRRPLRSARLFRPWMSTWLPTPTMPGADGAVACAPSCGSAAGAASSGGGGSAAVGGDASSASSSKLMSPTCALRASLPTLSSCTIGGAASSAAASADSSPMPSSGASMGRSAAPPRAGGSPSAAFGADGSTAAAFGAGRAVRSARALPLTRVLIHPVSGPVPSRSR
mmetsp:Transcript_95137/g.245818  ORF Transcript_95137/g.245818 Transcript_95137/m.245818 type:complete len:226 (-) Transcript_95137:26-703(-)